MAQLTRTDFNDLVVGAIRQSGWSPILLSGASKHPFRVAAVRDEQTVRIVAYVWSATHGGGPRNPDEYRIQVHVPKFEIREGEQTVVLGWWADGEVFAAFDVTKHSGTLGRSSSIQISLETLKKAAVDGFAVGKGKGKPELLAAFKPEYFMAYVLNAPQIHGLQATGENITALAEAVNPLKEPAPVAPTLSEARRQVIRTVSQNVRASNFRQKVLRAYDHHCAFCSMQLDLVDAAHVLPVAVPSSTDDTDNGVALCALHHRAFDAGLVTMAEDYEIHISTEKADDLRKSNRAARYEDFEEDLREVMALPPTLADRPSAANIKKGNQLRGWAALA